MIGRAAVLALLPGLAAAQEAPVGLDCLTEDGRHFRLEMWQPSEFGEPLHCVSGLDLDDVAGCAPQGGWGLTDPETPGALGGIARKSSEAQAAEGRFFARVGLSEFTASAARGEGLAPVLAVHGPTFWRMRMELATGEGWVFTREGREAIRCGGIQAGP